MNSLLETLKNLGPARLGTMAAVAAGIIAFFIYLTSRLASPEMSLLYADLDAQDSGQITARLEQMNVPYRITEDGGKILVPQDQVGRTRLVIAEEGLPSGGSIGYEIFDRSEGLGTTNFVQNINHVRALEGELARTIRSVSNVKQARVHLVLPRRELFSRDRQEPSASIVLMIGGARGIDRQQVSAIQHLVAAAVPGLKPSMVSIVDDSGSLLARGAAEGAVEQSASRAEEMRVGYEARMVRTIEELLSRSLGAGNIRAQVSAEMDFDRITENAEIFDPDGQVVRSTQVVEENANSQDGAPAGVTVGNNLPDALPDLDDGNGSQSQTSRTEETVNYEITKTVKTHIREAGMVRRLSVAVMVNGKTTVDAEGQTTYEARPEEEIEKIKALVRSAVGFDEARGDTIDVVEMPFVQLDGSDGTIDTQFLGLSKSDFMRAAELLVLGVVAILVLLLVVRPLLGRLLEVDETDGAEGALAQLSGDPAQAALTGPDGQPVPRLAGDPATAVATRVDADGNVVEQHNIASEIDQMIDLNQVEGRVRASSVRKIAEIIEKHPEEAVGIIRSWLYAET
ncbi:flagellar M-ring protein FliF [Pelagibius litoralis]|uniref:Flagellar M-ring protein n=1 Tax=Pelagibius litoralis TaxID=374515 RepID=A0A967EY01_9PROT|nr:flagellar basal-body MS-ring/collar protein FliF [Pelagibius litoralis]NIA69482.1 flagellar M-ring protein FliF [Pelagibius litoralis]